MRRFSAILLTLLTLLSLTACGSAAEGADDAQASTQSEPAATRVVVDSYGGEE